MKKLLLPLFTLSVLLCAAQKKQQHGYLVFRGGPSFKDKTTKAIAVVSVGVSNNNVFGIGASIGYINYEKPYLPLTLDLSFFGTPGKISPVIIGQAGYGVYNYSTAYAVGRGGFTGSINAGIGFPVKNKSKFILTAGYHSYGFSTTTRINGTKKVNTRDNRLAITFGIKI